MNFVSFRKLKRGVRFVCARYRPSHGTCQLCKPSTSLEQVLLAMCLDAKVESHPPTADDYPLDHQDHRFIRITDFALHGITAANIALGHVKFTYQGIRGRAYSGATVFTLDLDMLFSTLEPAALFAAINFPLNSDTVMKEPSALDFIPYYRSSKHSSDLAGLVSVDGMLFPERATIHTFKPTLDSRQLHLHG